MHAAWYSCLPFSSHSVAASTRISAQSKVQSPLNSDYNLCLSQHTVTLAVQGKKEQKARNLY